MLAFIFVEYTSASFLKCLLNRSRSDFQREIGKYRIIFFDREEYFLKDIKELLEN